LYWKILNVNQTTEQGHPGGRGGAAPLMPGVGRTPLARRARRNLESSITYAIIDIK